MKSNKGFTLIELLVVISIVSLLSSIIIASVSTAREKAKIAAGKTLDSRLFQAYGADALLILNLEQTATPFTTDESGSGGVASIVSPGPESPTSVTDTPYGSGRRAADFGGNDAINITPILDNELDNSTDHGNNLTYSVWFKPIAVAPTNGGYIFSRFGYHTGINYRSNNTFCGLIWYSDNTPTEACSTTKYELGKWYHIAFSISSTNRKIDLYVNGALEDSESFIVGKNLKTYFNTPPTAPPVFNLGGYGTTGSGGYRVTGIIDSARLYNKAIGE